MKTIDYNEPKKHIERDVVFMSNDVPTLLKRLEILYALFHAGNTAVMNEMTSITDQLLKTKKITKRQYFEIRSLYNK